MSRYEVVYILPYGAFIRVTMEWDHHKSRDDFQKDINYVGQKLGATFIYMEDKE